MLRIPSLPFGVARTETLYRAGVTRHELRQLVATGGLTRLQRGWYASAEAHPDVLNAIRHGGRLSCLSALHLYGAWMPPRPGVHIRLLEHAHHGRSTHRSLPSGVHRCRAWGPDALQDSGPVDPLPLALPAAARCTTGEYFVAIMDSLLRTGRWSQRDLAHLLRACPAWIQTLVGRTDRADAGTESLVRQRLRAHRIPVRPQVEIPGVGRVDLVVGERLVIEVDSVAHHSDPGAYARDRDRDLALTQLDFGHLRLTHEHVMSRWAEGFNAIMTIVDTGEHLRPRRPRL